MTLPRALASAAAIVLLAAAPIASRAAEPAPSPAPSASAEPATISVVCRSAPLFVFTSGTDRPMRARTPNATMGERFGRVSGPRTTLEGYQFYETNIPVAEPGYPAGAHYWINRDCAIPN